MARCTLGALQRKQVTRNDVPYAQRGWCISRAYVHSRQELHKWRIVAHLGCTAPDLDFSKVLCPWGCSKRFPSMAFQMTSKHDWAQGDLKFTHQGSIQRAHCSWLVRCNDQWHSSRRPRPAHLRIVWSREQG